MIMKLSGLLKAIILIGGPSKGTRFRPLSLETPKPLFPIAGMPMIQHQIDVCARLHDIKEVLIIGYYPAKDFEDFIEEMIAEYKIAIKYLREYSPLGTGGCLHHFRDAIRSGGPSAFFVLNGDVCGDFPLQEMYNFHKIHPDALVIVAGTEATRNQSLNYGCIVSDKTTSEITHYVEKPSTFVSTLVNCGVYLCTMEIFSVLATAYKEKEEDDWSLIDENEYNCGYKLTINLEKEVLQPLAGTKKAYVYQTSNWWSQLKTGGSAIYANRHYLQLHKKWHPERLQWRALQMPQIIGDVYIHPSAKISPSAVIGPNVSIGPNVHIGAGTRIRESIVLHSAFISRHCLVLYSIIGQHARINDWCRIEGTPCDPNPNKPFAKMDNLPLFNSDGRLNPSITILGGCVVIDPELVVLNSIVLPYKELGRSFRNEIIL